MAYGHRLRNNVAVHYRTDEYCNSLKQDLEDRQHDAAQRLEQRRAEAATAFDASPFKTLYEELESPKAWRRPERRLCDAVMQKMVSLQPDEANALVASATSRPDSGIRSDRITVIIDALLAKATDTARANGFLRDARYFTSYINNPDLRQLEELDNDMVSATEALKLADEGLIEAAIDMAHSSRDGNTARAIADLVSPMLLSAAQREAQQSATSVPAVRAHFTLVPALGRRIAKALDRIVYRDAMACCDRTSYREALLVTLNASTEGTRRAMHHDVACQNRAMKWLRNPITTVGLSDATDTLPDNSLCAWLSLDPNVLDELQQTCDEVLRTAKSKAPQVFRDAALDVLKRATLVDAHDRLELANELSAFMESCIAVAHKLAPSRIGRTPPSAELA